MISSLVLTTPVIAAEAKPKPKTLLTNVNVFDGKREELETGASNRGEWYAAKEDEWSLS